MNPTKFKNIEIIFWWIYVLVPLFTGILAYDWLPNEAYDVRKHVLLDSHYEECGTEGMNNCQVPDKWQSKETGQIFTPEMFAKHRHEERIRGTIRWFMYGMIGCFMYAYGQKVKLTGRFNESFGKAVLCNIAISLFVWWTF